MSKEIISNKQGISIITMYIMGSTLVLGVGSEAKQDVWISIIIGIVFALPMIIIYARLLKLYPNKNLFEIVNDIFGKIIGKIFMIPFIWYAFHLGVLVMHNFQEFIKVVSFPETPPLVPVMLMGLLCIWVVREGIEVLGRWAQFSLIILAILILAVSPLSFSLIDIDNLRPVLYNGFSPVLSGAFSVFSFPFAETVLFLCIFNIDKNRNNSYKIYTYGLVIGGFFVLTVAIRNLLILGPDFISMLYFPSYEAISLIDIGDFLQRIEIAVSVVFMFSVFAKISVCLLAASKGLASLLKIEQYRLIVTPIGLLMMIGSYIIYDNIMEMSNWTFYIYKYYAFPFQVILPLIIWICAEVKGWRKKGTVG
jgi:spore germination protein KB